MPLFSSEISAEQQTAEERICQFDQALLEADQRHRDAAAKNWKWGRDQLRALPASQGDQIRRAWNQSAIPAHAHYFADFVRTRMRRVLG